MAHFAQKAPTAPNRVHELHDQDALPGTPHKSRPSRARLASLVIVAIVFAVTFTALGIQVRAGWESHRDWVVPVIAQFAALGGVAAAYLVVRLRMNEFGIGAVFMLITAAFALFNYLRGLNTEGQDNMRDWFSVLAGISFGAAILSWVIGWLYVELTRPTKAPAPEM